MVWVVLHFRFKGLASYLDEYEFMTESGESTIEFFKTKRFEKKSYQTPEYLLQKAESRSVDAMSVKEERFLAFYPQELLRGI